MLPGGLGELLLPEAGRFFVIFCNIDGPSSPPNRAILWRPPGWLLGPSTGLPGGAHKKIPDLLIKGLN